MLKFAQNNGRMSLIIDLPAELEERLKEQAKREGKALEQYVTALIKAKVGQIIATGNALSAEETQLFDTINKGFAPEFWDHLKTLNEKRRNAALSESELQELISMTDQMELVNLQRMKALVELAEFRGADIDDLMEQLGLRHGDHPN